MILDIYKKIKEKKDELQPLYDRMDSDLDLYHLKPYSLLDYDGKVVKRVDNVTLNEPYTFAARAMSIINASEMIIKLQGPNLTDDKISIIKEFLLSRLRLGDKLLKLKRIGRLRNNLVKIAALRGIVGIRVLLWLNDKGEVVYDFLPLDARNCAWDFGSNGLIWSSYEVPKSRASIEIDYGKVISGKFGIVTEYFDKDRHIIFVDKDVVRDEENTLGYPPVFITPVGMAMSLKRPDELDSVKYDGESIYTANRQVYQDINKLASIWMTTAAFGFRPPMQKVTPPHAEPTDMPDEVAHLYTGGATVVDMGYSRLEPMPLRDINASLPAMFGVFSATRQKGSFPDVEFGEIRHPLSAIAIAKLTEGRNQIFQPIIESLSDCYQFLFEEVKKQTLAGKFNTGYKLKDIEGDYEIEVEFHSISPEENIANYSVAAAARGFLDSDSIRTNILKIRDEGQVQKKLDMEFAELAVPELRLYRVAKDLQEQGREIEARLILAKLGMALQPTQKPPIVNRVETTVPTEVEMPAMPATMEGSAQRSGELEVEMKREGLLPQEGD